MIIKGFQGTTLVDYPGHVASIVFTAGCTFNCGFCYNKKLVNNDPELEEIKEQDVLDSVEKRKKLIDGVVITGGEPTMFKDLPDFISEIKKKKLLVKLDTNGTNPEMIEFLIKNQLVDYIAMDIKNSPEKYSKIANCSVDIDKIKKTADLIKKSSIAYEFRTTALPSLITPEDFVKIGKWLSGAKKYCIQQFRSMEGMIDEKFRKEKSYSTEELEQIKEMLKPYFELIEVRA